MSLKKRLLTILLLSGFILALLFHFSINATIVPDLRKQKEIFTGKIKKKLRTALFLEEKRVRELCNSWSKWDDLINYIKNPSARFEENFLTISPFSSHKLNLVLILDPGDNRVYNKNRAVDVNTIPFDHLKMETVIERIVKKVRGDGHLFEGIVRSDYGPVILAANAVDIHIGKRGILIMGRFVDQALLNEISLHFTEPLQLITFKEAQLFAYSLKQMESENDEKITIFYPVNDIDMTPAALLKVEADDEIFRVAGKHTTLYVLYIVLSILFLGTLIYLLIEKYINKRIINISKKMKSVQGFSQLSTRIDGDTLGDEISSLVTDINTMLDKIETEKKSRDAIEQRLITSEKLVSLGRLSASIAHEIHNPILAISNCLQAIKKACAHDNSGLDKKAFTVSETEIKRIRNIISNLLDFHRPNKETFSRVDVTDVIQKSLEICKWSKKPESIKITVDANQAFYINGSHSRLKQVFINFILNAIEANGNNKGKGTLRIKVLPAEDDKYCEVHFIDNGPGVSPGIKNKLFEPFVSTKQEKGVGLGLYVSYKIIENHNGEIIYNDTYKDGAHFIIKLPHKQRTENEKQ